MPLKEAETGKYCSILTYVDRHPSVARSTGVN